MNFNDPWDGTNTPGPGEADFAIRFLGTPQSFNVLMKEMQSLCLDIRVLGEDAL